MLISINSKSHLVWLVSSTSQIMLYAVVESVSSAAGLVNTGCNKLTCGGDQLEPSQVQGLTQTSLQQFFMFYLFSWHESAVLLPVRYFSFLILVILFLILEEPTCINLTTVYRLFLERAPENSMICLTVASWLKVQWIWVIFIIRVQIKVLYNLYWDTLARPLPSQTSVRNLLRSTALTGSCDSQSFPPVLGNQLHFQLRHMKLAPKEIKFC